MYTLEDTGMNTYCHLTIDAPSLRNSVNICIHLIFLETKITPLTVWVYLHSNFSGALHKLFYFWKSDVSTILSRSLILVQIESAYKTPISLS